jgi:hypothetical protein
VSLKSVIQGLAAVWLVLFVASFVVLRVSESDGSTTSRLALVAEFLTWQALAFIAASLGAFTTRFAAARGIERVKLVGYVPLAVSVFLVGSFVVLIGFRFYVAPLFE